jgi:hypothetical protein
MMMYFDASNPYHRYRLHYESNHQLSLPELIARGSVDAHTAAIVWYLLEHRASYIIAGPTDPTPGVGKTTTLNALLPFYPAGTGLVYTLGMYEDFAFTKEAPPRETTVLANEVSDHLVIYMWGKPARRFLRLPAQGFAIATSCHADTLKDVLAILTDDIHLLPREIQQIQLIVNIGLHGHRWPQQRRWLTTHFIPPATSGATDAPADASPAGKHALPVPVQMVSCWDKTTDSFIPPAPEVVAALAAWAGVTPEVFQAAVARREHVLADLAAQKADQPETILAVQAFRASATGTP